MCPLIDLPFMKKSRDFFRSASGGADSAGMKEHGSPAEDRESPQTAVPASDSAKGDDLELRLKLYRLIMDRYREKIEEYETKTISEMKLLVQPHNHEISELKGSIADNFHPYSYVENFLPAARMAFEHVASYRTISAPVSFWLGFSDMRELMAGDEIDKSTLLCSILRSLGSENAKVFVTDSKNSYVVFEFSGKTFTADHSQKELSECPGIEGALLAMKGKALYSFNDREYEDFQE